MGIASIARYSLAVIQRSSDSAFAGGCDSGFAIAAFTRDSVIGGCLCKWQFLRVAALPLPIECQIGLNIDRAGNCKTEYQLNCQLALNK